MASDIYGSLNSGGVNQFGFKPQSVQDNNQMANFLQSSENKAAATGSQATATGQGTTAAGIGALAPALQYLTQLTKGDTGDVSQAIQPEVNRIKDSFTAVRQMIAGQPRGGGKAGALADASTKEAQQKSDVAAQLRSGAVGQLGQFGNMLAGIGIEQQGLGERQSALSLSTALQQRGQNLEESGQNKSLAGSLVGSLADPFAKGAADVLF